MTRTQSRVARLALVGNPNAGKTSLFNALTGGSQKVGNFPGVTVEKASGHLRLGDRDVQVLDVPGLYSLQPVSADERVASQVIRGMRKTEAPLDLLVCVLDATNLERNLFFLSQVAELGKPLVVALTMTDLLDPAVAGAMPSSLSAMLGVPVIAVSAPKNQGLSELRAAIETQLDESMPPVDWLEQFRQARIADFASTLDHHSHWVLPETVEKLLVEPSESDSLTPEQLEKLQLLRDELKPTRLRYAWAQQVAQSVLPIGISTRSRRVTDRIDSILTHRFFGLVVFLGVMFLVFQSIYTFAGPMMEGINSAFSWLGDVVSPRLESTPMLQSLVVDGIIAGVGGVVVFLPQILILFFFIALLEGSGYLARAAFLMDKLLGWCGLNGRAFIPLLSSFACAIPGIMATRVMPDQRSRLATILVAPLMSCSARLPVYVLLIGAFIEPQFGPLWAGFALFGMHLVGLLVAIPIVHLLNRGVIKGQRSPFLLEMPPYQAPKWRDIWFTIAIRAKVFLKTAGTIIVALSIVIWALLYFPRSEAQQSQWRSDYAVLAPAQKEVVSEDAFLAQRQIEQSYLGRFGHAIEPVFRPAGFDWRISTAILAAFPAREVLVSSFGILFSLGGDVDEENTDLRTSMQTATWPDGQKLFTPWTAVGLMVFFALCCQCMATLATIKRETNSWKWPIFTFTYMTGLAYLAAVLINALSKLWGAG